ncbi:methylated-DNA--[protein]-cysteine S-methyltransferase [Alteromonadaceae bacterium M269]|nr:methylated-DNA--[protein]-cysteine S-methyltransferase [Alteromonadaceae bacterium M269]
MTELFVDFIKTPIGLVEVKANVKGLVSIAFIDEAERIGGNNSEHTDEAVKQLDEYFRGQRKTFSLNLDANGTEFQESVWKALVDVPYGETASYGEIAKRIGKPKAMRAVGAANGRNPLAIVVPCHRIIGSTGKLVGYASGVDRKTFLLDLESS